MPSDSSDAPTLDGKDVAVRAVTLPSRSPLCLLAFAWGIGFALYALVVPTGLVSLPIARVINDLGWTVAAALATWSAWRAARSQSGRERLAWRSFTLGCAAWTAGQILWDLDEFVFGRVAPVPGKSDIGYLAFGLFMIAGLFVLRSTRPPRGWAGLRMANLSLVLCALAVVLIAMLSQLFFEPGKPTAVSFVVVTEPSSRRSASSSRFICSGRINGAIARFRSFSSPRVSLCRWLLVCSMRASSSTSRTPR